MSRRIPVLFGHNQRLVSVDFDDFEKTKEAIRKKWKLSGDFVLQAAYGNKGEYMDIVDDDDLSEFSGADTLTVHMLDGPPGAAAGPNVGPTPPPSYEQSIQTPTSTPQPQPQPQPKPVDKKVTVKFEGSRKLVTIDTQNLQNTKQAIRQKIPAVPGTFDLFAETPGQEDTLINNDADLSQCKDAKTFLVCRPMDQSSTPKPGKTVSAKSNEKRVTVIYEGKQKPVPVDFESLDATKEEIRKRFNLSGDIDVLGQLPDSEEKYDIENDTDLLDFKDAVSFHVRAHPSARQARSPDQGRDFTDNTHDNRPHNTSRNEPARPIFMTQVPPKVSETKSLPVSYGGRRRSVTVELDNVAGTKRAIRQRLMIDADFVLKARVGTDDYRDIIDESDLEDLRVANELVVEDLTDEAKGSNARSQQVVPVNQDPNNTQDEYLHSGGETAVIEYKKIQYVLYQPPPPKSQVVVDQQQKLIETMNITKLVDKMELTADFLRLAYFGVLGNKELHKKIQKMQFDVAELSKQCSSTAVQFKIKAEDVIENLECGFAYLLEGNNDFALQNFENIGTISKDVLEKTKTLKDKVEKKEEEIEKILEVITEEYRRDEAAGPPGKPSAWTEQHLKSRIEKGSKDISQSYDQCKKLEDDITKSKSNMAKGEQSKKPVREDFFRWVKQGYLYTTELDAVVTDKEKMLKNMAKEDRLKELEEMKRARLDEQRANRELLKMVETMKRIDMQTDSEGMLKMALRGAETGVRALLAALKPIIEFWENLAVQCDSIANTGTAARLKEAASPTERNKEFWTQPAFKRQALNFFAKWVALRNMCHEFQKGMEKVGEGIHLCIQENPSVDEARKRMKDLLAQFDARVKKDQAALESKEGAADQDESEDPEADTTA